MSPATATLADALERLVEQTVQRVLAEQQHTEPASEERSPWMSTQSAAAYLDWPSQRLYKLTACGEIPHYKHEGRLLFRRDELDAWLQGYKESDGATG
jgi:excisionase family DNA binding protein